MKNVYLDNNGTTFIRPEVIEAVKASSLVAGNASSMHSAGREAASLIAKAREQLAAFLDCDSSEIIYTGGATESNNTVLNIARELIDECDGKKSKKIIISSVEHPSIIETAKYLRQKGYIVEEAPVDKTGRLDLERFVKMLGKDTVLVSLMAGNNETGTIQPVEEVCRLAHNAGALFHTDATQVMGKIPFSFRKSGADYMSLSAHKFYGPKGIGALVVKNGAPFRVFMHGGHQEGGARAGTYNTQGIVGMGVAASLCDVSASERLWKLREKLRKGIEASVPEVIVNGSSEHCLPGTLDVSFPRAEGESILLMLDLEGIQVSTGSACATGSLEPSYVLLAGGLDVELAHGSIRFSLGDFTTEAEIDYVLEKLPPIIERLREMSTR